MTQAHTHTHAGSATTTLAAGTLTCQLATFLIVPCEFCSRWLRRFTYGHIDYCPMHGEWGHDAWVRIEDGYIPGSAYAVYSIADKNDTVPRQDSRWPTHCDCGYEFQDDDHWQVHRKRLYVRSDDSGDIYTLDQAPVGALFFSEPVGTDDEGASSPRNLNVMTPHGIWCLGTTDSQHRLWGNGLPYVTVDSHAFLGGVVYTLVEGTLSGRRRP